MWTHFLSIVERATRKCVHINDAYVDILVKCPHKHWNLEDSGVTLEIPGDVPLCRPP